MVDNGDGPRPSTAAEVIRGWQTTLSPLDAVYHQVRNRARDWGGGVIAGFCNRVLLGL